MDEKVLFVSETTELVLDHLHSILSGLYHFPFLKLSQAYERLHLSARIVLAREVAKQPSTTAITNQQKSGNVNTVTIVQEGQLLKAMLSGEGGIGLERALFHLARVYDEGHFLVCQNRGRKGKKAYNADILAGVKIDAQDLIDNVANYEGGIELRRSAGDVVAAHWTPTHEDVMRFTNLPTLTSLGDVLPGETTQPGKRSSGGECAGIAGGGGSDAITLSALSRLFPSSAGEVGRRRMELLISTRAWLMESTGGAAGTKGVLGRKRQVKDHAGPVVDETTGKAVTGTYRITKDTSASGRDLEPAIVENGRHEDVWMVLDQGGVAAAAKEEDGDDRVDLAEQYRAVLATHPAVTTVFVSDTGGDVFGTGGDMGTPDQDLRAQRAVARVGASPSSPPLSLVTVVIAPGSDAPLDAPAIAAAAGGAVYHLTPSDRQVLLAVLVGEYRMDGNTDGRYSRTTLCLIEWLRGRRGWVGLNMPLGVVDTDQNPWKSFGFVRECMGDIVFMPLLGLLPLIDPETRAVD